MKENHLWLRIMKETIVRSSRMLDCPETKHIPKISIPENSLLKNKHPRLFSGLYGMLSRPFTKKNFESPKSDRIPTLSTFLDGQLWTLSWIPGKNPTERIWDIWNFFFREWPRKHQDTHAHFSTFSFQHVQSNWKWSKYSPAMRINLNTKDFFLRPTKDLSPFTLINLLYS